MRNKSVFDYCPRCGERTLEHYHTYGYCLNCNFNTEEGFSYEKKEAEIVSLHRQFSRNEKELIQEEAI